VQFGLDRNEVGALLVAAGLGPPAEHALISLLALNGLLGPRTARAIDLAIGERTDGPLFVTATLDAGVPLRDVQEAASHADPRTTMRYDRARTSLDRHATYIVAAFIAGAGSLASNEVRPPRP
jgi:hypothetical protein